MGDWQDIISMDGDAAPWEAPGWADDGDDEYRSELKQNSEIQEWRNSMESRGYSRGPTFSSYLQLSEWDKTNNRPHVRRRSPRGFEVYFTGPAE